MSTTDKTWVEVIANGVHYRSFDHMADVHGRFKNHRAIRGQLRKDGELIVMVGDTPLHLKYVRPVKVMQASLS